MHLSLIFQLNALENTENTSISEVYELFLLTPHMVYCDYCPDDPVPHMILKIQEEEFSVPTFCPTVINYLRTPQTNLLLLYKTHEYISRGQ